MLGGWIESTEAEGRGGRKESENVADQSTCNFCFETIYHNQLFKLS